MKALVYEAPRVMVLRDLDEPRPGPDDVLIRVAYSGICGSELGGYLGEDGLRAPPFVFGHEVSGTVAGLGERAAAVHGLREGQRVTANPLVSCMRCRWCRAGREQLCSKRRLLGAHLPGSNAEYVNVAGRAVHRLPDGMNLRTGALVEPAACAVRAVGRGRVTPSSTALVIGTGPIGLFIVEVLRLHGVETVIAVDKNAERLAAAQSAGATTVHAGSDPVTAVLDLTGGAGAEVAFDAVGSGATRLTCVRSTQPGGRVVLVGLHTAEASLPANVMIRSEIDCLTSFAYTAAEFAKALDWLKSGRLTFAGRLVTSPLTDGPAWFERLVNGSGVAKVLLCPGEER